MIFKPVQLKLRLFLTGGQRSHARRRAWGAGLAQHYTTAGERKTGLTATDLDDCLRWLWLCQCGHVDVHGHINVTDLAKAVNSF